MATRLFGKANNRNHYRAVSQMQLIAAQAAASRIFEVRNSHATKLIVVEKLAVGIIQNNNFTAAMAAQLTTRKVTGFTAVDTTNTVTPVGTEKRTGMVAAPGAAAVMRALTFAGNLNGITGGTIGASGPTFGLTTFWALATLPTAGPVPSAYNLQVAPGDVHPLVLGADEGLTIENAIVYGAAGGALVNIEFEWSELDAL